MVHLISYIAYTVRSDITDAEHIKQAVQKQLTTARAAPAAKHTTGPVITDPRLY